MSIAVDITIKDTVAGTYIRIPVIPESLPFSCGEALYDAVKILNLGNIEFFSGVDLDSMAWSGFFPARYDPGYCKFPNFPTPMEYWATLEAWKNQGIVLQLIIPVIKVNKQMQLRSFQPELKGAEGDVYYSVAFKEYKPIVPIQVDVTTATDGVVTLSTKVTAAARPPVPQAVPPKTYTVKAGDTLTLIAKKLPAKEGWKNFYEKNKAVIGADPNKIIPGQVLTV